VLAATNRDLPALVRQGLFREDLFYRLSTIAVEVPALRDRRGDVALLARHFVAVFNDRYGTGRRLGGDALALLERHDWPGNVRELQHAVEAAMVVCDGDEILPGHLPRALARPPPPVAVAGQETVLALARSAGIVSPPGGRRPPQARCWASASASTEAPAYGLLV
jgi:DNA-binding NtrC family response regulator